MFKVDGQTDGNASRYIIDLGRKTRRKNDSVELARAGGPVP